MSGDKPRQCADLLDKLFDDYKNGEPFDGHAKKMLMQGIDALPEDDCKRVMRDSLGNIVTLYILSGIREAERDEEYHLQRRYGEYYVSSVLSGLRQMI